MNKYQPTFYNDIMKALKGEGSRGGKIIGHTRSGKPIYRHLHDDRLPRDYTHKDMKDASEAHAKEAQKYHKKYIKDRNYKKGKNYEMMKHHQKFGKEYSRLSEWASKPI